VEVYGAQSDAGARHGGLRRIIRRAARADLSDDGGSTRTSVLAGSTSAIESNALDPSSGRPTGGEGIEHLAVTAHDLAGDAAEHGEPVGSVERMAVGRRRGEVDDRARMSA
jgi:hypothetical protein